MVGTPLPPPDDPDAPPVEESFECDACGRVFPGKPASKGLMLSTRGDEVRYEEPPLCDECARSPVFGQLRFEMEDFE